MQQRTDQTEPVGEATIRIPTGEPTSKRTAEAESTAVIRVPDADATTIMTTSPNNTSIIPLTDPDATARLAVGDATMQIEITPDDASSTQMIKAPSLPTPGDATGPITVATPPRPSADHRPEFAVSGIVAAIIGMLGLVVPDDTIRLVMLLVFAVAGPGSAVLAFADVRNRLVSWALAVISSMTLLIGVASLTLWTHIWQPTVVVGVLTVVTLGVSVYRMVELTRAGVPLILGRSGPAPETVDNGLVMAAIPFVTTAAAAGLWAIALSRLTPSEVGLYGLSASLGVPFILAVVLMMIGFAVELFGRARPAVLALVLVLTPIIVHATVPLLDGTIEYAWTYKHLGVVDLLRDNGHLLASNDIYQMWPGFFAVVAMLSHISGLDGIAFVAWSSLFFALANSLMVAALLRQFTRDRRVLALGVLIVQIAMWVDIGYFSPQAYVYTLMLGFWVIVVRWLLQVPEVGEPKGRIGKLRAWAVRGMPAGRTTDSRTRLWAALAAGAVFAAITMTHQLTPFMMMVPVVAFAIVGMLRPRLLAVGLIVVLIAFVAPRLATINSQYSIFSLDFLKNASGNSGNWNTPEQEFSAAVARTLAISLWLGGLIALFLSRKKLGRVVVAGALGFLPMATLVAGNYGGEAIYRVFAFSLPFMALLIGVLWIGRKGRRGVPAMIASGVVLAAMMLAGLQGLQGQLYVHQVKATDIQASEYFYANAKPDSALVLIAPNFPTKLAANYGSFNRPHHVSVDISLVGEPQFTGTLSAARLPDVTAYIRNMGYNTNYVVVSESMARYTDYFGTAPKGTMAALDAAMSTSPEFTLFYRAPGVAIFQLNPVAAG